MSQISFDDLAQKYLLPLASTLGLGLREKHVQAGWGEQSASSRLARVMLECDRGLYWLSVGPAVSEGRAWGIEQISELFPRIRKSPSGHQRLSLEEQVEFILQNWGQLEELFSPENAAATNSRLMHVGR